MMEIDKMKIKTLTSPLNETNMYILRDSQSGRTVLIDPSDAAKALQHLEENDLALDYILLTHEHYDHIAALNELRAAYPAAQVVASGACSDRIQNPKQNLSKLFNIVLAFKKNNEPDKEIYICDVKPYAAEAADIVFQGEYRFQWQGHELSLYEAPGHSKGSILIIIDRKYLFSGDTVSYDYELITGLPGGSRKEYEAVTAPLLQSLDRNMMVYPGHGRAFRLYEI